MGEEVINCYKSRLDDIKVNESRYFDSDGDPMTWENVWFCVNETEDEEQRIYVDKTFDVYFEDKEAQKDCYADLKMCYETLKERKLL